MPLLWSNLIPATLEGRAMHNVQNAMFAAAMAHSMGVGLEDIRHGLRTFDTTFFQAPGRMNIFDEHPFKVILDYGHNAAAVGAMVDLVQRLDVRGRRICVLSAPGDRRDEDVHEIAKIAAGAFDRYVCRRDDVLRGRAPAEIPELLRATLTSEGVAEELIDVIPDEVEATEAALRLAGQGDLLLVFGDNIARTWKQIQSFTTGPPDQDLDPAGGATSPVTLPNLPDLPDLVLEKGQSLIRDERGVRIAREVEEAD